MPPILDTVLRIAAVIVGVYSVLFTITSALRTFVLPRADNVWLTRQVFRSLMRVFQRYIFWRTKTYNEQDRVLAFFAPVVVITLPIVLLFLLVVAFTPLYWAFVPGISIHDAFLLSGSSLLTLGYAGVEQYSLVVILISFLDAALGMIMVALLIAYLPTIYNAFSERERQVAMLEVRAGTPPRGSVLLDRSFRNNSDKEYLTHIWERWEDWFSQLEESHTSLIVLCFFRSPSPERSWITAAGAVLDAAALYDSSVDMPRDVQAVMMIRAGYIALRAIADFFRIEHDPSPEPDGPISVTREEFDEVIEEMRANGVPLVEDMDEAWRSFRGWRVNYDRVLVSLARLISAPYAPWSSDRSLADMSATIRRYEERTPSPRDA